MSIVRWFALMRAGDAQFWAGGNDIGNEGNWRWLNRNHIDDLPWGNGQPDNKGDNQDCLVVNYIHSYDDDACTDKKRFICESDGARCVGGVNIGYQCLTFSHEAHTWEAAKAACASNLGQLASLADPDAVLAYVIGKYGNEQFWAGGNDIGNEGEHN
ncbi:unnamed protein product [Meganyctiphanes norvegica]|uniref:C-type lectin domain-containing protein n=1 Tax=Meganyctiphanes norvegica TaxID=48144 RepID=A0AAV2SQT2_MEGNR